MSVSVHQKSRPYARQKGIASIEFAVSVILLLVLMLAVAELGRAFYSYNTLTKAVRSGVRYISDNALNTVGVVALTGQKIADTRNMVIYGQLNAGTPVLPSMDASSIDVVQAFPSGVANPYVQVTANYEFTPIFAAIPTAALNGGTHNFTFTMQARSTMRVVIRR